MYVCERKRETEGGGGGGGGGGGALERGGEREYEVEEEMDPRRVKKSTARY